MKQSLLKKLLITILLILLGTLIIGQIAGFFIIRNWFINEITEYFEIFSEDLNIKFIVTENVLNIPDFFSNENRISQVLFILLDNAFKFTLEDGHVKLDAFWDEEIIRISVENTGEGISNEDIQFVFERFYKSDKSHNGNGSGLGLSIAKEIIRNLGEEIYVSSEPRKKTKFEFTIHRNINN